MLGNTVAVADGREWAIACDVQHRFMQDRVPATGGLDCSARCRQVHDLGGDCYDFVPLPGNQLAIAVGDASGKGVAAALMISGVQLSLRTAAMFCAGDPAAMLGAVNRQVYATSLDERYATLFYGVFDAATHTLRYVNAGHNPAMVMRRDGSIEWLETGGAPVGMFPEWTYEKGAIQLESGDVVVAYTDGVVETEWGLDGFRRAALASRARPAQELVDAIFASMGALTDDATVAVLRVR